MGLILDKDPVIRAGFEPLEKGVRADGTPEYHFKGLFPAMLVDVSLKTDTPHKTGEFANAPEAPTSLHFEFLQLKTSLEEPDRYFVYAAKIIPSKKYADESKTRMIPMTAKEIQTSIAEQWKLISNLLSACEYNPNYVSWKSIPDEVWNDVCDLPLDGEPADRIAKFKRFYETINNLANYGHYSNVNEDGTPKPVKPIYLGHLYPSAVNLEAYPSTRPTPMYLRLQPEYNSQKRYDFDKYVRSGVAEPIRYTAEGTLIPPVKITNEGVNLALNKNIGKKADARPYAAAPNLAPMPQQGTQPNAPQGGISAGDAKSLLGI